MDVAKCTQDGNVYIAHKFSLLSSAEIAQKRKFLICTSCGSTAFYRKASRSGQAACFGARPHKEGCDQVASEKNRNDDSDGEDQDAIKNPGTTIIVDFGSGSMGQSNGEAAGDVAVNCARPRRYQGNSPRQDAQMHRRLSVLLLNLMESEQFSTSEQTLEIHGKGKFLIKDFFVKFADISPQHEGQYRGYWGKIYSVRLGKAGELWFNPVGRTDLGIRLNYVLQFLQLNHLQMDGLSQLGGCFILAFGTFNERNGKKTILVEENHLALKKVNQLGR